jgi:RNA polymerase sigma-70 factor (ECF subfamily)
MEDITDEHLVDAAQAGDGEAFAELARRHQTRVYKMILRLTRNPCDADDLTQEAFLQAFRSVGGFKQKAKFTTWIYRIALNLTLNHLKKREAQKQRREIDPESVSGYLEPKGDASSPEGQSLQRELQVHLDEAIDALPLIYRAAFLLVELQGLNHREASVVLRCSEKTVSWRMHKARRLLQSRLISYLERGVP